jgi:hypothetical protein
MASLQNSMPVQAIVLRRKVLGRARIPSPGRGVDQGVDPVRRHVEDDDLLVRRGPHPGGAVRLGHVGQPATASSRTPDPTVGARPT